MHNIQLKKLMNVYCDRHKEIPGELMPNLAASDAVKYNGTRKVSTFYSLMPFLSISTWFYKLLIVSPLFCSNAAHAHFSCAYDETLHCIFIRVGELEIVGGHGGNVTYLTSSGGRRERVFNNVKRQELLKGKNLQNFFSTFSFRYFKEYILCDIIGFFRLEFISYAMWDKLLVLLLENRRKVIQNWSGVFDGPDQILKVKNLVNS
uniref:Uncharacterized protein n=1 Tax=Lactuca sativa TaxID=4236 RepID=A0A9R1XAI1_LACSA|nr:hypothetical protein LSAT_V11C500293260 [Lactuca sativa]